VSPRGRMKDLHQTVSLCWSRQVCAWSTVWRLRLRNDLQCILCRVGR